jgi:hypothetical protein
MSLARENVLVPVPDRDDAKDWPLYAHEGREGPDTFDGYEHAEAFLGCAAGKLANDRLAEYEQTGTWRGTFEELRCCLFFEARRWRHIGWDPEGPALEAILALVRTLRSLPRVLEPAPGGEPKEP